MQTEKRKEIIRDPDEKCGDDVTAFGECAGYSFI